MGTWPEMERGGLVGGGGVFVFLFTDIEGSTRLWERWPEAMGGALARHDEIIRGVITGGGGRVFKTVGDAFCACFESAGAAVLAGVEIQRGMLAARGPWEEVGSGVGGIEVRVAVHCGVAQERDGDLGRRSIGRGGSWRRGMGGRFW